MSVIWNVTLLTMLFFILSMLPCMLFMLKEPKPLTLYITPHLKAAWVDIQQLDPLLLLPALSGTLPVPEIHIDLTTFTKDSSNDLIFFQHLQDILTILGSDLFLRMVPNGCSIFSVKLYAIMLAFHHVQLSSKQKFWIISDLLSALQGFLLFYLPCHGWDPYANHSKEIVYIWVPAYAGILGKVWADQATKASCQSPDQLQSLVLSYCKSVFKVQPLWQHHWVISHPSFSDCPPPSHSVWCEEVVVGLKWDTPHQCHTLSTFISHTPTSFYLVSGTFIVVHV